MGFENGRLVRVVMRAIYQSDSHVNTFHYDLIDSDPSSHNDPQSLADAFRDAVVPKFRPLFNNQWTVQPVIVMEEKDPQNEHAARSEWTSGTAQTGTKVPSGEALPNAMTSVATLVTDHVGRRYRGRVFLPGNVYESDVTNGFWSNLRMADLQAYLDSIPRQPDLATGPSGSVAHWVVYSRTQRAADIDPYASPVRSATAKARVQWLRSREA